MDDFVLGAPADEPTGDHEQATFINLLAAQHSRSIYN
jgi:hypothetical protein